MTKIVQKFQVLPDQANQTLAAVLRHWMKGQSWSQVRELIQTRRVLVNRTVTLDDARRLAQGETVEVLDSPQAAQLRPDSVTIRYQDDAIVVVEKPAGITTMRHPDEKRMSPRRRNLQPTLDETVRRILMARSRRAGRKPNPNLTRLFAVHRLDRDTSGLIVFGRTPPAARQLVHQFREHTVHRAYWAVVRGQVESQTIRLRLVRDRGDGRRGITADKEDGKRAITHVRPLEPLGKCTLIECRLETGRTHQIRLHLEGIGHPVCGDKVYLARETSGSLDDPDGFPRQALHSRELGFRHPTTGEYLQFEMPLPDDMSQFLARLRAEQPR